MIIPLASKGINFLHPFLLEAPHDELLLLVGSEGDVRKRDDGDAVRVLEMTVKQFGRLDILVNAADDNFLMPGEDEIYPLMDLKQEIAVVDTCN
ncbi:hypothetical protein FRX31_033814 [Thalictrum thalictroides]|uniref:Uncharacterized protein n=1 Tax=Thalictrum thalictroides TaxID=46969 RepID=A0A7J6UWN2_THATH|nr:hypothetical protein FRX31_033814 [Thalictrum thalictroides]